MLEEERFSLEGEVAHLKTCLEEKEQRVQRAAENMRRERQRLQNKKRSERTHALKDKGSKDKDSPSLDTLAKLLGTTFQTQVSNLDNGTPATTAQAE